MLLLLRDVDRLLVHVLPQIQAGGSRDRAATLTTYRKQIVFRTLCAYVMTVSDCDCDCDCDCVPGGLLRNGELRDLVLRVSRHHCHHEVRVITANRSPKTSFPIATTALLPLRPPPPALLPRYITSLMNTHNAMFSQFLALNTLVCMLILSSVLSLRRLCWANPPPPAACSANMVFWLKDIDPRFRDGEWWIFSPHHLLLFYFCSSIVLPLYTQVCTRVCERMHACMCVCL